MTAVQLRCLGLLLVSWEERGETGRREGGKSRRKGEGVGKLGEKETSEGRQFERGGMEGGNKLKEMMSQHAKGVGKLLGGFEGRLTK